MLMAEVVPQIHRLACCTGSEAHKELTFTNINNKDLDILCAGLNCDDDNLPVDGETVGMDDDQPGAEEDEDKEDARRQWLGLQQ